MACTLLPLLARRARPMDSLSPLLGSALMGDPKVVWGAGGLEFKATGYFGVVHPMEHLFILIRADLLILRYLHAAAYWYKQE
jgi:hypothetical protein